MPEHQVADCPTQYSWVKPVLALLCLSDPKALKSLPPHLLPCCSLSSAAGINKMALRRHILPEMITLQQELEQSEHQTQMAVANQAACHFAAWHMKPEGFSLLFFLLLAQGLVVSREHLLT